MLDLVTMGASLQVLILGPVGVTSDDQISNGSPSRDTSHERVDHRHLFALGALLAGILADVISIPAAIYAVAALTAASGLIAALRMYETHPR